MDVMTAAFNVAEDYPGGARALALAIGENANTFTHAVKETAGAALRARTVIKMSKRSGDFRVVFAIANECGFMCVPLPETLDLDSNDCMKALAASSKEYADLVQATCAALAGDGKVNDNEMARVEREVGESIAQHQALLAALRAHRAASPKVEQA